MKSIKLLAKDIEYVKILIERDIIETAADTSFFEEMKIKPRDYIDEMISLSERFGLDFWNIISRNSSDFELKRLRSLYEGKSVKKSIRAKKGPASK